MAVAANFLDTNVLIYAFSDDARAPAAQSLMAEPFVISAQALNEFANVGKKKLGMSWTEVRQAVVDIATVSVHVLAIDNLTTLSALELAPRYNTGFYDALMLAAALQGNCERFYSEDLHDGLVIEKTLTVINPFR